MQGFFPAIFSILLFSGWILLPNTANSQGFFEAAVENPFGFNFTPSENTLVFHTLADIDNDGDLDDFVSHREYVQPCWVVSAFEFYENQGTNGNPVYVKIPNERFGLPPLVATIALVDIDADGDLDAFISDHCFQSTITFHENTGSPAVPQFNEIPTQTMSSITGIGFAMLAFGDLDGDGDYDALINGYRSAQFFYLENTGTPTDFAYTAPVINPFGLSIPSFNSSEWSQFADWDCDGDLDILNSHWMSDGTHNNWLFYLHENTGSPTAPSFQPGLSSNQMVFAMTLGDMDGDGDLDVFSDEYYFKNITTTGCLTATVERENKDHVSIFPNPASDYLSLKMQGSSSLKPLTIEVINPLGETVKRMVFLAPDFNAEIRVDLGGLASGFYMLKISGNGHLFTGKFSKVN
jgi:hypothetical protein